MDSITILCIFFLVGCIQGMLIASIISDICELIKEKKYGGKYDNH